MTLTDPWAAVIAAVIAGAVSVYLALRTSHAKRDALEKLVAAAVKTAEANHREQVKWLQSQILYYQQLSQPARFAQPIQPPDQL